MASIILLIESKFELYLWKHFFLNFIILSFFPEDMRMIAGIYLYNDTYSPYIYI